MNLAEIGAFLKAEREKRGLSLDDVAKRLKINPRLLTALEAGNEAGLPHHAYVRGFIRSYASLLGIGHDETQALLAGVIPTPESGRAEVENVELPSPPKEGGHSFGKILAPLIILGALAGGAYAAWQGGYLDSFLKKEKEATLEEKLPEADKYLAAREKEAVREKDSVKEGAPARVEPEEEPVPASIPAPLATPELPTQRPALAKPEAAEPVAAEPAAPAREEPAPAEPSQHKLIITAIEECWVHSNADKTDTRQFSLRKGDTFALTFAKTLELKLGNAGGVRLRYDGNDLPPPGTSGQVKTIAFPPKNDGN